MKNKFTTTLLVLGAGLTSAHAEQGLYSTGEIPDEPLPLEWVAGLNFSYDDNITPTVATGTPGSNDESFSVNPYVGVSFVRQTPQDTLDVFARVGAIYYLDEPDALGAEELFPQLRLGVNWFRSVNERLRFTSRNFVSYEIEPDFERGFSTTRQVDSYFFWQTDNAVGYRWTERLGTYTGIKLTGLDYDSNVRNQDRFTWQLYNQFRYQLTEQTVLTSSYRYSQTTADGLASDSSSHHILGGVEHRFSPNTVLIARVGAQIRQSDAVGGNDTTSPFLELALRSQINEQFSVRGFARYSVEDYDTTRNLDTDGDGFLETYDFDGRETLRIGVSGEYVVSSKLSFFADVNYVPSTFDDGRLVRDPVGAFAPATAAGVSEDLINFSIGASVQLLENVYGSVSYNYTDSDSDFTNFTYDRNRINVGVRAEF